MLTTNLYQDMITFTMTLTWNNSSTFQRLAKQTVICPAHV